MIGRRSPGAGEAAGPPAIDEAAGAGWTGGCGVTGGGAGGVYDGTDTGVTGGRAGGVYAGTDTGVTGGRPSGVYNGTDTGVTGGGAGGVYNGTDTGVTGGGAGGVYAGTDTGVTGGRPGGVYDGTDSGVGLPEGDPDGKRGAGTGAEAYGQVRPGIGGAIGGLAASGVWGETIGEAASDVGVNDRARCGCAGDGDDGVATEGHGARGVGRSGGRVAGRGGVGERGRTGAAGRCGVGTRAGGAADCCSAVIPTGITPPQAEQRARTPPCGTFAGSTR